MENGEKVSYFVLEGIMTHYTNIIKRIITVLIIVIAMWLATIGGFLWYLSLPVEEVSSVEVENADGTANYIGNDMEGTINNYGESNS